MVRMLSQNDILSDTENQAVNIGGLANTDNWKKKRFLQRQYTQIAWCYVLWKIFQAFKWSARSQQK